jgi:hypothetical protein
MLTIMGLILAIAWKLSAVMCFFVFFIAYFYIGLHTQFYNSVKENQNKAKEAGISQFF